MKVGLVLECTKDGADVIVYPALARRIYPDVRISCATLGNKAKLIQHCGITAASLLADGCERVLVIWDLYPPWREKGQRPCRREDRQAIIGAIQAAGVALSKVSLVCTEKELETLLLADGRALSAVLSTDTHPIKVRDIKTPERDLNPKKTLMRLFKKNMGRDYQDPYHAKQIVEALPDLTRLGRIPSFVRFRQKLSA